MARFGMASRTKTKRRRVAHSTKKARSPGARDADADLRTGSRAPTESSLRPLEASIGFEVRRMRKSIDLTVSELGAAAGISAGMLSKIENGSISPSLATLDSVAKALKFPISPLLSRAHERPG